MPDAPALSSSMEYAEKNALVQGGGGLWFLAHIGVLRFMQESRIPIHVIAGASGGALIGAIASTFIDEDGMITQAGVDYMEKVARCIQTYGDLTRVISDKTVINIEHLLRQGNSRQYSEMMNRGPTVPFFAQAARREPDGSVVRERFLEARPGDRMERVLAIALASAANRPMFRLDPVEILGQEYFDDVSVSHRSVNAQVRQVRARYGGIRVMGTSLSFKDSSPLIRWGMDVIRPQYKDCGDVRILPKDGHQAFDGKDCLTNWSKGGIIPGMSERFARRTADLLLGNHIEIPVDAFIEAGYEAAAAQREALLKLAV